jgi:hypothetical protein
VAPLAVAGILAGVDEPLAEGLGQLGKLPEIDVVAVPPAGQKRAQSMVEVVVPLGVEPVAAELRRRDGAHVVEGAFGDDLYGPDEFPRLPVDRFGQLLENVPGPEIEDPVDGIDPQSVHVVLRHPVEGVADEVVPHLVAVRAVEVDRLPPRGPVAVGEVRSEAAEVVPLRPQVVVDDVEDHRQPPAVAGVDQLLQALRPAVAVLGGEGISAVIAPVPLPGKLRHRHQFHRGHPELRQVVEAGDDRHEGPLLREGPDVQLIDDVLFRRQPSSRASCQEKARGRRSGRAVHSLRLEPGRVGPLRAVVESIKIVSLPRSLIVPTK